MGEQSDEGANVTVRVLVAEDAPPLRRLMTLFLERLGCEVEIVADGREAVERRFEGEFDLVLMDYEMPVMNGIEAARAIRLREAGAHRRVPILAMTAHSTPEDKAACMEAGMDGLLPKPMEPHVLPDALARWTDWQP